MVEKKKSTFLKIIGMIFLIVLFEAGAFSYSYFLIKFSNEPILAALKSFFNYSPLRREFIFSQAILLGIIIFIIILNRISKGKRKKEKREFDTKKIPTGSGTSLDALYKILLEKKSLNINFIEDLFGIKKDLALEWARILESGDLATLDYPGIGAPKLVLKEKISEGKKEKEKEDEIKKEPVKEERPEPTKKVQINPVTQEQVPQEHKRKDKPKEEKKIKIKTKKKKK